MRNSILIVDDEISYLETLKTFFELKGFSVNTIADSNEALNVIQTKNFDCILLDIKMPGVNGIELLQIARNQYPPTPIIMVSGQSNSNVVRESFLKGAFDFIEKSGTPEELLNAVNKAIKEKVNFQTKENVFAEIKGRNRLIGNSKALQEIREKIETVADTPAKVLIQGESGTGKELVAWALHFKSSRNTKPYIKINCASIPPHLFESEMFGHKKGAFTGAYEDKEGKFVAAEGGTLFLDEIGDMSLHLQAKLLKVLDDNVINIVGSNKPKKIDIRIIAATNQNLLKKIDEGTFRKDLYHRLNVVNIYIPPLRERREDILPLAYHFLEEFNESYHKNVHSFNKDVENILIKQKWEGNVRELRNTIEQLVVFSTFNEIGVSNFEYIINNSNDNYDFNDIKLVENNSDSLKTAKDNFEKDYIIDFLNKNNWRILETANALGIDRSSLFKKMQKYGIKKE